MHTHTHTHKVLDDIDSMLADLCIDQHNKICDNINDATTVLTSYPEGHKSFNRDNDCTSCYFRLKSCFHDQRQARLANYPAFRGVHKNRQMFAWMMVDSQQDTFDFEQMKSYLKTTHSNQMSFSVLMVSFHNTIN